MSQPTADDWLLSLDHNRTRRLARAEQRTTVEESTVAPVPDADQGALGVPPSTKPSRSPDSWLMEITDIGRGEHTGDSDDYDRLYAD
jgi:hypothetical protein